NLALAEYEDGNLTRARTLADESVSLLRSLQADGSLAEVLITRGQIVRAQGDAAAAYAALSEALRFALTVGPRLVVPDGVGRLPAMIVERGQTQLAALRLAPASALREQMGTPVRPVDQTSLTNTLTAARSALGPDTFVAVWAGAKELTLDQLFNMIPSA